MKKRRKITAKIGLVLLLLAALAMVVLPFQAWATENDSDDDGILNELEGSCLPEIPTGACVNTNEQVPDLFIQLVPPPDGPSILPENPFELITRAGNPFVMNLHVIGEADAQSQLIIEQPEAKYPDPLRIYAVRLEESLSDLAGDLGVTHIGVPTDKSSGTVFTRRIRKDVDDACALAESDEKCTAVDSEGIVVAEGRDAIYNYYAKEVCAHEIFHALGRVVPKNRKVDYHYPMLGYIMDHHMEYKESKKHGTVTWTIHNRWAMDVDNDLVDIPRYK